MSTLDSANYRPPGADIVKSGYASDISVSLGQALVCLMLTYFSQPERGLHLARLAVRNETYTK